MRRSIGRSNGSASPPLSRSSADFIMHIAGCSFRKGHPVGSPSSLQGVGQRGNLAPKSCSSGECRMNIRLKLGAFTASVIALSWGCGATGAFAADPVLTRVLGDVLWPPRLAYGSDDQRHLVYELRLANSTPSAINLAKAEVIDAATGKTLLDVPLADIGNRFSIGGRR